MNDYDWVERPPSLDAYRQLREAVGWGNVGRQATEAGLRNSLYWVTVLDGETEIGCGRVIGDGGLYFYVQDIIVLPAYQGRGLGRRIMQAVMAYLEAHAPAGAFLGLMAARDGASFYYQFGFSERPPDRPGMFQIAGRPR